MCVPSASFRETVMLYVGLVIHATRIAVCALNQTGQGGPPLAGPGDRGHAAGPRRPGRPLRGVLRGELRVRALPRPAPPTGGPGARSAPRPVAADLPVEAQERPERRRAAGEVAVP